MGRQGEPFAKGRDAVCRDLPIRPARFPEVCPASGHCYYSWRRRISRPLVISRRTKSVSRLSPRITTIHPSLLKVTHPTFEPRSPPSEAFLHAPSQGTDRLIRAAFPTKHAEWKQDKNYGGFALKCPGISARNTLSEMHESTSLRGCYTAVSTSLFTQCCHSPEGSFSHHQASHRHREQPRPHHRETDS